jgi:hypothetical protein
MLVICLSDLRILSVYFAITAEVDVKVRIQKGRLAPK